MQLLAHYSAVGCVLLLPSHISTSGLNAPQNILLLQAFVSLVKEGRSVATYISTPANTPSVSLVTAMNFYLQMKILKLVVNRGLT